MKKHKEDNLYIFIHSMTPSEKRYLKRYAKSNSQYQYEYLRFFDVINNLKFYDKKALIKQLEEFGFHHHLEVKKHHLLQLILDSMREYRSAHFAFENSLMDIDILIEKGLYHFAHKRIKIQKEKANYSEDSNKMIQLINREIFLSRYMNELNVKVLLNEMKHENDKYSNILEYKMLLIELNAIIYKNSFVRNATQASQYENFKNNKLVTDRANAKSKTALIYFYQFNYILNASIGNQELAYDFAKKMYGECYRIYDKNQDIFNLHTRSIIARLSSLILKGFEQNEFNELITELKIKIDKTQDPEIYTSSLAKYYQFKLLAFSRQQEYDNALKLLKNAIEFVKDHEKLGDHLHFVTYLKFDIAKTYFILRNYSKANKWFVNISVSTDIGHLSDIYIFSRILSFLCDIFLNETDNILYNINYLRKKLGKLGLLYEFESFLLNRISTKFIHWNTLTSRGKKELLESFKLEVKHQLSHNWKANTTLYFDFEWWTEVMITNIEMN